MSSSERELWHWTNHFGNSSTHSVVLVTEDAIYAKLEMMFQGKQAKILREAQVRDPKKVFGKRCSLPRSLTLRICGFQNPPTS